MSQFFEAPVSGDLTTSNGDANGHSGGNGSNGGAAGTAAAPSAIEEKFHARPIGLNAQKVVSKRYSLKDANGNPVEQWPDIVRRVVGHVSKAEQNPQRRDDSLTR